jgi:hypothetical protein
VGTRLVFALAVMAVVAGALWLSPSAGAAQ